MCFTNINPIVEINIDYVNRLCQKEAVENSLKSLNDNDKCLLKLFCGAGKSRIIVELARCMNKKLSIIVFPSLALIDQFSRDYLGGTCPPGLKNHRRLNVDSDSGNNVTHTTSPADIKAFLGKNGSKIICVTYHSLDVLLDNLDGNVIGIALFDEAHNCTSINKKHLVFEEPYVSKFDKRVFLTATPLNKNGIIMNDKEDWGKSQCGPLVQNYTYLQGVRDGYLKTFDIRVDISNSGNKNSMYEAIARAIYTTGNSRVLSFHADVSESSPSDTSVSRFVNPKLFNDALTKVGREEFPHLVGKYKKVTIRGLTALSKDKSSTLDDFDKTKDNEIYVLASCNTIGEGVNTKNANMCVFVDPKTSYKCIIQNIGRIVRDTGNGSGPGTVLVPVKIDDTQYKKSTCNTERDEVIRESLGKHLTIANICAALNEEDEELYETMIKYPRNFTPREREWTLEKQGCVLDKSNPVTIDEIHTLISDFQPVEIHKSDVEEPVITHNEDVDGDVNRFFEDEDGSYYPIVESDKKKIGKGPLKSPDKSSRCSIDYHVSSEIEMLWGIDKDYDLVGGICSCILQCSVSGGEYRWIESSIPVFEFVKTNERRPKITNPDEKPMVVWIATQEANYNPVPNNKDPGIVNTSAKCHKLYTEFRETYPLLFPPNKKKSGTLEDRWIERSIPVFEFVKTKERRPLATKPDEKKMATWLNAQETKYNPVPNNKDGCIVNTSAKCHKLYTEFKETYPLLFPPNKKRIGTREDRWIESSIPVFEFVKTNERRPKITNPDEKPMMSWINTQEAKYNPVPNNNDGCIVNASAKCHGLYTEFREKYPLLFPPNKIKKKKAMGLAESSPTKPETIGEKVVREKAELSVLHQRYKTMSSSNLHEEFSENPDKLPAYHRLSTQNELTFPEDEIPRNLIIRDMNDIKGDRSREVRDFGCGEAKINKYFEGDKRFKFKNYDHVSLVDGVDVCDIKKVPDGDNSVEIVIMSLAMWGSNSHNYPTEAYRVLESGGVLHIAEPTKRWSETETGIHGCVKEGTGGAKLIELLTNAGFQVQTIQIKKFCYFRCVK